jgi:alkylation response protein AidB-like acyl-CoA dehydrogenase
MYRLTDEQQRIVAEVAAVADQSIAPNAARVDSEKAFPTESIAGLAKAGLLGLTVPSAFGGLGKIFERWPPRWTKSRSDARRRRWCI